MKKNYSLSEMPIIDLDLAKNLITEIDREINSLKYSNLKTEEGFTTELKRLQQKVSLSPVEFSKPEIINHRAEEKLMSTDHRSQYGGKTQTYIITVKVGFKGSPILFNYRPNGFQYSSSVEPLIQQPSGDAIYLDIEHGDLGDKEGVLKEVDKHMQVTYMSISSNNKYINDGWISMMTSSVEQKLTEYKQKLEILYGN